MKNQLPNQVSQVMITFLIYLSLLFSATGCGDNLAASLSSMGSSPGIIVTLGFDLSLSFIGYRQQDTTFVADVCHVVSSTGGLIVAYGIGEPTDQSGLRCYLKPLPKMDNDLVLSKQAELKQQIKAVAAENEKQIRNFLKKVQTQIFVVVTDPKKKINNTDINGYFKKVNILLNEPENQKMTRYVFAYTDGIQSLNGFDSPACYKFKTSSKFTLCLAGWKTKLPCDSIETKKFEDPEGFLQYLESNNSFNH